jgi:hypothetical protein
MERRVQRLLDMDVHVLGEHIIEVVVDQGIEVTSAHVHEMLKFASSVTGEPRGLLANRQNDYSFSFPAMLFISRCDEFRAVAVVTHGRIMQYLSQALLPLNCHIAFFKCKKEALAWLESKLKSEQS